MSSTSVFRALVLCAPGGVRVSSVAQESLVRYLRSGTYVGLRYSEQLDTWTDGEWVWDAADLYFVRRLGWIPTDVEFGERVREHVLAPAVSADYVAELAEVCRIRREPEPRGVPWVPRGVNGQPMS